jgi:uncharacterized protein (TIGR02594 family)
MVKIHASVGRNAPNRRHDVETVQHLLNTKFSRVGQSRRLIANGTCGADTIFAIEDLERNLFPAQPPSGTLQPHGATMQALVAVLGALPLGPLESTPWLKIASGEEANGVKEWPGLGQNNPAVLKYLASFPGLAKLPHAAGSNQMLSQVDETPWCACFVNWCLLQAGKPRGPSASARDWLRYGSPTGYKMGAITIVYRKLNVDTATGWHVGFWIGGSPDAPALIGGNQGNSVCRKSYFDLERVEYRWPM